MTDPTIYRSCAEKTGDADVYGIHDAATGSWQYICADPETGKCAIVDPVQDFDPASARASLDTAQNLLSQVEAMGLEPVWILDTHPHADHFTAGHWLREQTGAPHGIGEKTREIAALWRAYYNLPNCFDVARDFDRLFGDGDTLDIGKLQLRVMLSPGHTLGSITFVVGNAAFVHDTLMHVDVGTARADFPGGSSSRLWQSIMAILHLPAETRLFIGHDYGTQDRETPACEASVARHRTDNPHFGGDVTCEEFVRLRDARDLTLNLPDRMLHALQVNLRGGRLPPVEDDGHAYFKIPANRF